VLKLAVFAKSRFFPPEQLTSQFSKTGSANLPGGVCSGVSNSCIRSSAHLSVGKPPEPQSVSRYPVCYVSTAAFRSEHCRKGFGFVMLHFNIWRFALCSVPLTAACSGWITAQCSGFCLGSAGYGLMEK